MAEKKVRKLDKARPYGEIYGGGAARFEQHGIQFDAEGHELPGFEKVKLPEVQVAVPVNTAESEGLIRQLQAENLRLSAACDEAKVTIEDAEAKVEELQGQLDTAQIEVQRLTSEVEALKTATPAETEADRQLKLQQQPGGNKK